MDLSHTHFDFEPARVPTFYFVGVTTGKSSIMTVFPRWAEHLGLGGVPIRGIDCKWHDDPGVYRAVVDYLKNDELSVGGLVTTHKIDLLTAARDRFEGLDSYAELLGEVSSISKRGEELWGHAKDPITSGLSLQAVVPDDYWAATGADLFLLGAGGSSLALTTYLMQKPEGARPARIVVANRSVPRLEEMQRIHADINPGIEMEYVHAPEPGLSDAILPRLAPGSVVANATGLGKDAPGSPLTDDCVFPENAIAWDFNYRGDLVFLDQARSQADRGVRVEDGWVYFIHGWTRVIAEVFHIDIPTEGPEFEELSAIASSVR
ncbi:shikimate dehydrogenase, partial [bacterium]|nr:shikimate dehydrogenase [bacterium]